MSKRAYTVLPPDREEKVLGIFVRDASFYRTFFPLLLVIVLQQLAALAVNLADNIMLGRYSELALSGASLVNQLQFTLQQIAAGAHVHGGVGDNLFPDGVHRRVGHLGKELFEIIKQGLRMGRQQRQRRIGAHGGHRLIAL